VHYSLPTDESDIHEFISREAFTVNEIEKEIQQRFPTFTKDNSIWCKQEKGYHRQLKISDKKKHSGVVKLFPKDRLQQWKRVFEFYKSTQEIIDYTIEQSDPVIYNGYIIYNDNSKFTFQFQLLYLPNLDVVISTYKTDLKCPTCGNKNLTICARCEDKKCAKCNPFCACHSAEDYEKIIFEGDQAKIEQLIPKDLGLMKLTFRESK